MSNQSIANRGYYSNALVLEGGPSTGKSSLIKEFRARGFRCIDEVATQLIQEGLTPDVGCEIFQTACKNRQLEAERIVRDNPNELFFLDRGLLSSPAYLRYHKCSGQEAFSILNVGHYAMAFIVDHLDGFEYNGIRPHWENLDFTIAISELIESEYAKRGIPTTHVPQIPASTVKESIKRRADFILAQCRERFFKAADRIEDRLYQCSLAS